MRGANLVLRFLLELSALAATAYWGFSTTSGVTQWVLGLGAPALVAVVWGLFVSPKAKVEPKKAEPKPKAEPKAKATVKPKAAAPKLPAGEFKLPGLN